MLKNIIAKSIIIKADLVSADELEMHKVRNPKQSRMLLNFGHTIGHAVEAASKFQISHGKAVSIGMVAECAISQELGLCSSEECERLEEVITRLGLPLSASSVLQKDILSAIGSDKKTIGGKTRMALLLQIGEATIIPDVPLDAIKNGVKVIGA